MVVVLVGACLKDVFEIPPLGPVHSDQSFCFLINDLENLILVWKWTDWQMPTLWRALCVGFRSSISPFFRIEIDCKAGLILVT